MADFYSDNAEQLCAQYDALASEQVHQAWKKHLPKTAGLACDIGAGSGRDARWLASKGWDVIAVEPCDKLRELAGSSSSRSSTSSWPSTSSRSSTSFRPSTSSLLSPSFLRKQESSEKSAGSIVWLNDKLPQLSELRKAGHRFDLVLLSAVWMHLSPAEQAIAYQTLEGLLAPKGTIVITWRNQADETQRQFHPVDESLFETATISQSADQQDRNAVVWKAAVIRSTIREVSP
jgi:2-polyprenyl-3-methyl-5-hydroxy-6-metoxy-1,4-benzoquinol methylase